MGKENKYTYFQISRETAFGSPVYVHSHVRSIQYASSKSAYNKAIQTLYDVVEKASNKTNDHLNQLILYFESKTNELIEAGYPTRDGKPYGLTNTFKELSKDVLKIYDRLINPQRRKRESITEEEQKAMDEILDKVIREQDKTIEEIVDELGEEYSDRIVKHFVNRTRSMLNSKKYGGSKENQLTSEEISVMAARDIVDKLKKNKSKNNEEVELKKSVRSDIKKSTLEVVNIVNEWNKFLDDINLKMNDLLNPNTNDTQLKYIINALHDGRNRFLKLGLLMEAITAYSNNNDKELRYYTNSNKVIGDLYLVGNKDKSFELGDQLTTDIKAIVDKTQQVYGISVKLNPVYFRKQDSITKDQLEKLYGGITDNFNIENLNKELVYFLTNYAILSKMYYPKVDTKYRNINSKTHEINGNVLPPIYGNGMDKTVNLWGKIRNMLATNLFIKAVIGSFFLPGGEDVKNYNEDKVRRQIEQQGAPLIIQSSTGQYWSKDMLKYLRDLSNNDKAVEVIENFREDLIETLAKNADSVKQQFQELFRMKVQNALDNPPVPGEDRYANIYSKENIRSLMGSIQDAVWKGKNKGKYGIFGSLIKVERTIKFRYNGRL